MGKINIIIEREFNTRVRKRSFIISTLLTPILLVGLMVAPAALMMMKTSDVREILVVDRSGVVASQLQNGDNIVFTATDQPVEQLKNEKPEGAFGILVIGKDVVTDAESNVDLYTFETSTLDLDNSISKQIASIVEAEKLKHYNIDDLSQILESIKTKIAVKPYRIGDDGNDTASSTTLSAVLAYIFGFIMYFFVFAYGAMVMQGVIEEKSSRVLEIIVSSVKPFQLMMGKIVGIALVALTQFVIWVILVVVLGSAAMQFFAGDIVAAQEAMAVGGTMPQGMDINPEMLGAMEMIFNLKYITTLLGGFLIYFIGGYLLYAAMFAAVGSAVSSVEEAQQLQMPITIPIILAIVIMMNVIMEPHSSIAVWFSIIPLTSPIIMMARLPYGVPLWQIIASIVALYGSFVFMVWMAAKIYRVGIFMYGKKPSFKELYKWMKYKS